MEVLKNSISEVVTQKAAFDYAKQPLLEMLKKDNDANNKLSLGFGVSEEQYERYCSEVQSMYLEFVIQGTLTFQVEKLLETSETLPEFVLKMLILDKMKLSTLQRMYQLKRIQELLTEED
jgi:hypothetical protein